MTDDANRLTTDQEAFWAGDFGTEYASRNTGNQLLASNVRFFARALRSAGRIESCVEFGANVGMNLRALRVLYPDIALRAVEINPNAAAELATVIGPEAVFTGSILDHPAGPKHELSLVKGVLIHINPDVLDAVYDKIVEASSRYVLVCEYYNPTPVSVSYRGHADRLFKRDFAGEILDRYDGLTLVDYGFAYRRDPAFPQDDITWFLLRAGA